MIQFQNCMIINKLEVVLYTEYTYLIKQIIICILYRNSYVTYYVPVPNKFKSR